MTMRCVNGRQKRYCNAGVGKEGEGFEADDIIEGRLIY